MSWWQSLQDKDMAALERMTLDDYLSVGGPGGRTVGRDKFLAEAEQFLANAVIQDWSVTDLEARQHGDVAVCSYLWTERGIHQDMAFELRGLATDVLVLRKAGGGTRRTTSAWPNAEPRRGGSVGR
jgi:ketosteroid isomerase-like protein